MASALYLIRHSSSRACQLAHSFMLPEQRGGLHVETFYRVWGRLEQYATDILARMYPHRPGLVDRLMRNMKGRDAKGREFEIDAFLLDVSQAVFFETKAAFLREDAITHSDPDSSLARSVPKYGAGTNPKQRDKGVAQLARSIGAVMRGEWLGDHHDFANINVVYPVLVAHDMPA